jgi:tetratricopeptide (TPR) repeat protein
LREAIEKDVSCRDAHLRLAGLYERHNQPLRALETLEQAVACNPDDLRLLTALGETYLERDLLPAAETVYGRILVQGDQRDQALAYQHLGEIYARVRQYQDAFDCYVQAEELLGNPGQVAEAGYQRIFEAADGVVAAALQTGWEMFTAFVEAGPVAREEAYLALEDSAAQIAQIRQFGEQLELPESVKAIHAQRQLFYAVTHEAVVTAQIYLDTGNPALLTAAQLRREQADQERQRTPGTAPPTGAG